MCFKPYRGLLTVLTSTNILTKFLSLLQMRNPTLNACPLVFHRVLLCLLFLFHTLCLSSFMETFYCQHKATIFFLQQIAYFCSNGFLVYWLSAQETSKVPPETALASSFKSCVFREKKVLSQIFVMIKYKERFGFGRSCKYSVTINMCQILIVIVLMLSF